MDSGQQSPKPNGRVTPKIGPPPPGYTHHPVCDICQHFVPATGTNLFATAYMRYELTLCTPCDEAVIQRIGDLDPECAECMVSLRPDEIHLVHSTARTRPIWPDHDPFGTAYPLCHYCYCGMSQDFLEVDSCDVCDWPIPPA